MLKSFIGHMSCPHSEKAFDVLERVKISAYEDYVRIVESKVRGC